MYYLLNICLTISVRFYFKSLEKSPPFITSVSFMSICVALTIPESIQNYYHHNIYDVRTNNVAFNFISHNFPVKLSKAHVLMVKQDIT